MATISFSYSQLTHYPVFDHWLSCASRHAVFLALLFEGCKISNMLFGRKVNAFMFKNGWITQKFPVQENELRIQVSIVELLKSDWLIFFMSARFCHLKTAVQNCRRCGIYMHKINNWQIFWFIDDWRQSHTHFQSWQRYVLILLCKCHN